MTETSNSRRRVTYGQLEQLWEFLNCNRAIATGFNKTSQAREFSKRMWENIAENLNSHGDGAIKDWKGWCKYWNDYKSKLKKLAAAARSSHQQTGGGAPQIRALTEIEKKFLHILGEDFGSGLPGIRVEPFEEASTSQKTVAVVANSETSTASLSILNAPVLLEEIVLPGPSRLVTPPPPATPPPTTPTRAAGRAAAPPSTPRRSPRRGRHRRRETPLTQDAARRALIRISERRAQIEEENKETLKKLVDELKEIKEILRSRLVEHPRDDV